MEWKSFQHFRLWQWALWSKMIIHFISLIIHESLIVRNNIHQYRKVLPRPAWQLARPLTSFKLFFLSGNEYKLKFISPSSVAPAIKLAELNFPTMPPKKTPFKQRSPWKELFFHIVTFLLISPSYIRLHTKWKSTHTWLQIYHLVSLSQSVFAIQTIFFMWQKSHKKHNNKFY